MSTTGEAQVTKPAPDSSFLECHKLLNSMEESDSTSSGDLLTSNGHCKENTDSNDKVNRVELDTEHTNSSVDNIAVSSGEQSNSNSSTNGFNGVDESSERESSDQNDLKPTEKISSVDSITDDMGSLDKTDSQSCEEKLTTENNKTNDSVDSSLVKREDELSLKDVKSESSEKTDDKSSKVETENGKENDNIDLNIVKVKTEIDSTDKNVETVNNETSEESNKDHDTTEVKNSDPEFPERTPPSENKDSVLPENSTQKESKPAISENVCEENQTKGDSPSTASATSHDNVSADPTTTSEIVPSIKKEAVNTVGDTSNITIPVTTESVNSTSSTPVVQSILAQGYKSDQVAHLKPADGSTATSKTLVGTTASQPTLGPSKALPTAPVSQTQAAAPPKNRGKKTVPTVPPKKVPKELGPTASFLCDLGLDLVKEGVYKDLINIQSRKKKANKLSEAEEKQLVKLKDNYDNVFDKNKDVRVNFNLKCGKCKFVTESKNVMWLHHESPHVDERENLACCHCDFVTRIPVTFGYHMEAEHQMRGRITPKQAFWNCSTCPFETNNKANLKRHKMKCEKAFDFKLNLCPTSSHVNYCLAYNFYKPPPVVAPPKQEVIVPQRGVAPLRPAGPNQGPMRQGTQLVQQARPPIRHVTHPNSMQMRMVMQSNRPSILRPQSMQSMTNQFFIPRTGTTVRQIISSNIQRPTVPKSSPPTKPSMGLVSCEICKGFVKDKDALRVHFYFAHQIDLPASLLKRAVPPLFCEICKERFWTSQGLQKHKETLKHFPKPAQHIQNRLHICIICGTHVTHLLSHMSTTHNLSLKDFLIAKRCIVCGGSYNSRPSLEMHLASTHGILVKTTPANSAPNSGARPAAPTQPVTTAPPALSVQGGRIMHSLSLRNPKTLLCSICNISFLNNELLLKHCHHCHASCVGCGLIFANLTDRNRHKCSGMYSNDIVKCFACPSRVANRNMKAHVMKLHLKDLRIPVKRHALAEELAAEVVKRRKILAEEVEIIDEDAEHSPGQPLVEAETTKESKVLANDPVSENPSAEICKSESAEPSGVPKTSITEDIVKRENSNSPVVQKNPLVQQDVKPKAAIIMKGMDIVKSNSVPKKIIVNMSEGPMQWQS